MQIQSLSVYNKHGDVREIAFRTGKMNVITGDSRTGKSSLINIVRYLLGSKNPHAPRGPIESTVDWFGIGLVHEGTKLFIARRNRRGSGEPGALLLTGSTDAVGYADLEENVNGDGLRNYLAGLVGISDNQALLSEAQVRHPLTATLKHALTYCFQSQGEIANPDLLFHHQALEFRPQAIRDTLPYFLGAQGPEQLRQRQQLTDKRRELRQVTKRIHGAELIETTGRDSARSLVLQAAEVGLATADEVEALQLGAADVLRQILESTVIKLETPPEDEGSFAQYALLRTERVEVADSIRMTAEKIRNLERFAASNAGLAGELVEQQARLSSIWLVPEANNVPGNCPLCNSALDPSDSPQVSVIERAAKASDEQTSALDRAAAKIADARDELQVSLREQEEKLVGIENALETLASTEDAVQREREALNARSFVKGRIAQFLESSDAVEDDELKELKA